MRLPVISKFSAMKTKRQRHSALLILATLLAPLLAAAQSITSGVPGFISYQGRVSDSTGALVGAGTPVNRKVTLRIWNHPTNVSLSNLIYSEEQTVTIFEGKFSVLLGQGVATNSSLFGLDESGKGPPGLPDSFGGTERYIGVTVDDGNGGTVDNEITPRQQVVSSAFSFRSKFAETLGTSTSTALTVVDSGNVGVGTTNPPSLFTITGANTSSGTSTPQLLITDSGNTNESLRIGVDSTSNGTGFIQSFKAGTGAQNLLLNSLGGNVGIGTADPTRAVLEQHGTVGRSAAIFGGNTTGIAINTNLPAIGFNNYATDTNRAISAGFTGAITYDTVNGRMLFQTGTNAAKDAATTITTRMVMLDNGRIGIGGSIPTRASFEHEGTVGRSAAIFGGNTTGVAIHTALPAIGFNNYATDTNRAIAAGFTGAIACNTNDGTMLFQTGTNAAKDAPITVTNRMVILNNGNVGIGTTSPTRAVLEQHGSVGRSAAIFGGHTSGVSIHVNVPAIGFNNYATDTNRAIAAGFTGAMACDPSNGTLLFQTGTNVAKDAATTLTNRMVILSSGLVGIGTNLPGVPLEVHNNNGYQSLRLRATSARFWDFSINQSTVANLELGFANAVKGVFSSSSGAYTAVSDRRLKTKIQALEPVLDKVMRLEPSGYWFKADVDAPLRSLGFIAQDVEEVFPEAVHSLSPDTKGIEYTAMVPIAFKAIQELKERQDSISDDLEAENAELKRRLAALEAKDKARDAKLAAIEAMLSGDKADALPVSLKKVAAAAVAE